MADSSPSNELSKDPLAEILQALRRNAKLLAGLFLGLVFTGAGLSFWQHYQDSLELEAQAELFRIEKSLADLQKPESETASAEKVDEKNKESASKNAEAIQSKLAELENFVAANGSRRAGLRASIVLASKYAERSEMDKAVAVLQKIKDHTDDLLGSFHQFAQINALLDSKDYDAAVRTADALLLKKNVEFLFPLTNLRKALALQAKGEIEQAKALYKKIAGDYPEHSAGKTAKSYLRLLP